jgi:cell division protein FtsL
MALKIEIAAALLTVASAFTLYVIKHDTRLAEARMHARERMLDKLEEDLAVLAAERAWLARPERIQKLAQELGLRPITEAQYRGIEHPVHDGISHLLRDPDAPAP